MSNGLTIRLEKRNLKSMKTAIISEQGLRWSMEDAHLFEPDLGGRGWVFGGVYDGHGGRRASEYTAVNLHRFLLKHLDEGLDPEPAFSRAYEDTSNELAYQDSGTTAATILLQGRQLTVANAGDTRAIMLGGSQVRQLTTDHRLDNPQERERIEASGGRVAPPYVMRGFRGLMPTRSIGDEYFKPVGIIARPSTDSLQIAAEDRFLLLACDGLFDVMSNNEVAEAARDEPDAEALAERLRQEVLEVRMGTDNLTILILELEGKE